MIKYIKIFLAYAFSCAVLSPALLASSYKDVYPVTDKPIEGFYRIKNAPRDNDGNYWEVVRRHLDYDGDSDGHRELRRYASRSRLVWPCNDAPRDSFGFSCTGDKDFNTDYYRNFYRFSGPEDPMAALKKAIAGNYGKIPEHIKLSGFVRSYRNPEEDAATAQAILKSIPSQYAVPSIAASVLSQQQLAQIAETTRRLSEVEAKKARAEKLFAILNSDNTSGIDLLALPGLQEFPELVALAQALTKLKNSGTR